MASHFQTSEIDIEIKQEIEDQEYNTKIISENVSKEPCETENFLVMNVKKEENNEEFDLKNTFKQGKQIKDIGNKTVTRSCPGSF